MRVVYRAGGLVGAGGRVRVSPWRAEWYCRGCRYHFGLALVLRGPLLPGCWLFLGSPWFSVWFRLPGRLVGPSCFLAGGVACGWSAMFWPGWCDAGMHHVVGLCIRLLRCGAQRAERVFCLLSTAAMGWVSWWHRLFSAMFLPPSHGWLGSAGRWGLLGAGVVLVFGVVCREGVGRWLFGLWPPGLWAARAGGDPSCGVVRFAMKLPQSQVFARLRSEYTFVF